MDIKKLLSLQRVFKKTQDGRVIGETIIPLIENSLSNPDLLSVKMIKCSNCFLVLDEQYFFDGCRNCGSKDFKLIN